MDLDGGELGRFVWVGASLGGCRPRPREEALQRSAVEHFGHLLVVVKVGEEAEMRGDIGMVLGHGWPRFDRRIIVHGKAKFNPN